MATSLNPTTTTQFPAFSPPTRRHHRPPTEIRFSRWNNANAQKYKTNQKELEDQIRFERRFDSAITIAHNFNPAPPQPVSTAKSTGTPSAPSSPSIPAHKSKYTRKPRPHEHPAFAKPLKKKIPLTQKDITPPNPADVTVRVDDNGVCYDLPDAPFVYQYSYTETPKLKPVKLREPLVSPFGAETMPRPWTGRKPMAKKELPEFDSFSLPPPGKKGVKSVQSPGPFLAGSGPKEVRDRDEVLGEPLTKEEVDELIKGCMKSNRQLNIGRDGLTHNMLDNIHALWKRRRVCKIKCKGVCTVDMENVWKQLEEKTGGKIIYNKGGIVYLFRGRNYNYKYRPRFPLMLWKPVTPVYPRLVQRVPDGLTLEEATEMRRKGQDLTPICKLAKNGVYCDLVKNVREAFEACELARINCQGLNSSDYKKIGAKLRDLVPCVLMSFQNEHILVWRGLDWKSTLGEPLISLTEIRKEDAVSSPIPTLALKTAPNSSTVIEKTSPCINDEEPFDARTETSDGSTSDLSDSYSSADESTDEEPVEAEPEKLNITTYDDANEEEPVEAEPEKLNITTNDDANEEEPVEAEPEKLNITTNDDANEEEPVEAEPEKLNITTNDDANEEEPVEAEPEKLNITTNDANEEEPIKAEPEKLSITNDDANGEVTKAAEINSVMILRNQAVKSGMAFVLEGHNIDADDVFRKAVEFAETAPKGPVFIKPRREPFAAKKIKVEAEPEGDDESEVSGTEVTDSGRKVGWSTRRNRNRKFADFREDYLNVVPQGHLRVDELAKLLG